MRQFLFDSKAVYSVSVDSVHCAHRKGLTTWHATHRSITDLACMIFIDRGSAILAAGNQNHMVKISTMNGIVIQETPTSSSYTMLKFCRYICAATSTGTIDFLDPDSLVVVKQWQAQSSPFSSIDAGNDFLVTCGWSRRPGGMGPDSIARVFDLRQMKQEPPISFPSGVAFLVILPKMSTTCAVLSRSGQMQIVDMMNSAVGSYKFVPFHLDSATLSPSGNVWVFTDQMGSIHLWGVQEKAGFLDNPEPMEFPEDSASNGFMNVESDL